jgi:predicted AAA+ superfamily ATPase
MHCHSANFQSNCTLPVQNPVKNALSQCKIAGMLNISRNNIADYLLYMEEAGMISQLRSQTEGVRALGKIDKIYLENTNLVQQLGNDNQNVGNVRETFFLNQTRVHHQVNTSAMADFSINDSDLKWVAKTKASNRFKTRPKAML